MRLLVVEDEPKTAAYLKKGLGENGFVIDLAQDGDEALDYTAAAKYDLIVLDIMLPRRDGWSVLEALRAGGNETPVVCLTARDAVADRVKGLQGGADDYLTKPFAFSELLARVRTVLKRSPQRTPDLIRIADLELDLAQKEFALISLLARNAGSVLTRTAIAEQVWDMNFDCDTNVVDVHVRRLRSKVDDPFPRKLIRTVRGVGYSLAEE